MTSSLRIRFEGIFCFELVMLILRELAFVKSTKPLERWPMVDGGREMNGERSSTIILYGGTRTRILNPYKGGVVLVLETVAVHTSRPNTRQRQMPLGRLTIEARSRTLVRLQWYIGYTLDICCLKLEDLMKCRDKRRLV